MLSETLASVRYASTPALGGVPFGGSLTDGWRLILSQDAVVASRSRRAASGGA